MMPDELDAESLYVFVFGPGFGESIAIRVPPDRWMVVDSCNVASKAAALHVLEAYGGTCDCLMLTHRHRDHYRGFSNLIDWATWTTIGCSDLTVDDDFYNSVDPEELLRGGLEQAIASIKQRWSENVESEWRTWKTTDRGVGDANVSVLHPAEDFARQYTGKDDNELSCAVILTWKDVRLLLGADVPNPHWATISAENAELNVHQLLKVPHHGSDEALDDGFLTGDHSRICILTPYNKGEKLPHFEDGRGVQRILQNVDAIYLTGLPVAHALQNEAPCHATRQGIATAQAPTPTEFTLPGGITGTVTSERNDVSCYVIARFAENGTREILSCGPGSVCVTEETAETITIGNLT
jgi:beta-lactamase superfamily II metal-dependent hydrolase